MQERPKTVRVRVAVIVDRTGRWYAAGYAGETDKEMIESVESTETVGPVYFIEADLPVPMDETIQAAIVGQVPQSEDES